MLLSAIILSGCATVMTGGSRSVAVVSKPVGATVILDNCYKGITPLSIEVRHGAGGNIVIRKGGYKDASCAVKKITNTWFVCNILFGPAFFVGMGVDIIAGNVTTFSDSPIFVKLSANPPSTGLHIL